MLAYGIFPRRAGKERGAAVWWLSPCPVAIGAPSELASTTGRYLMSLSTPFAHLPLVSSRKNSLPKEVQVATNEPRGFGIGAGPWSSP